MIQKLMIVIAMLVIGNTAIASDRITKFSDVYGSAREIPGNIKSIAGTKTTKTKTEKKGLTFWQKIDKLILKQQNSNH